MFRLGLHQLGVLDLCSPFESCAASAVFGPAGKPGGPGRLASERMLVHFFSVFACAWAFGVTFIHVLLLLFFVWPYLEELFLLQAEVRCESLGISLQLIGASRHGCVHKH